MIKPLQDRILVEMDETIPTGIDGLIIPIKTDNWRGKDGAIESYNRGAVLAIGPGKFCSRTQTNKPMLFSDHGTIRSIKAGDKVRFSELQYQEYQHEGKRCVWITESDVVGVEDIDLIRGHVDALEIA